MSKRNQRQGLGTQRVVLFVLACATCFVLLLAASDTPQAQPGTKVWIGAGGGMGALFDGERVGGEREGNASSSLSAALYASYQSGVHVFSLRTAASGEWLFGDNFSDIGLLYGRARTSPNGHASVSIGLALVIGDRRCDGFLFACSTEEGVELADESESFLTIGLPIEAQLFWRPLAFGGFGLYGFANLNPEASFVGLTMGLQLGDLR